jgi:hypothetical protein
VALQDEVGVHVRGTADGSVEVVDFKPQQDAVTIGFVTGITDRPVVMLDTKSVQLKNQRAM